MTGSDGTGLSVTGSGPTGSVETKISGTMVVTGSLFVSGSSTFEVDGPSFLYGSTTVGSNSDHVLTVTAQATASNGLKVDAGNLVVDENATITGQLSASSLQIANKIEADDAGLGGDLGVSGSVTAGQISGSSLQIAGKVEADDAGLGGDLGVSGSVTAGSYTAMTASNGITVTGSAKFASEVELAGITTVLGALTASNDILIQDDIQLAFGTGRDATIEYDEDGTDELRFAGAAVTFEQAASFDGNVTLGADANDVTTVTGELTASLGMSIPDDKKLYFGTNFDWSIEYDEDGDDDLKLAGTTLTVTTDTATFTSANATDPLFVIKNTTNDADGARLRFVKDKGAAGAANDVAGLIEFYADDANQDQVLFSEIKSQVAVHTNGQEGGKLTLSVASHDGESQPGLIIADGSAEDEVDVTLGNGSASRTTTAGDLSVTTIANPGSDVDKFLVSNSGVVGFRTGAEVAADIGAVATSANSTFTGVITFSGDVTGSQGMTIPDDTSLRFGSAGGGDATIEYDEDGTDELRFAGAAVTFEQAVSFDGDVTLGVDANDVTTVTGELTASLGMSIPDDKKLYFGTGFDASIEYDEDGTDELRFAGAAVTFEQAVTMDANVTLGDAAGDVTTVTGKLTGSNGLAITGDASFTQNVTVQGDLDVRGAVNTTTHHETELHIADKAILIASGTATGIDNYSAGALDLSLIHI